MVLRYPWESPRLIQRPKEDPYSTVGMGYLGHQGPGLMETDGDLLLFNE
jgi:hypothetical protein